MPKHPVEEMLERFEQLIRQNEKDEKSIGLLMDYIEFFHEQMTQVSNAVAKKTEELFDQLTELTRG